MTLMEGIDIKILVSKIYDKGECKIGDSLNIKFGNKNIRLERVIYENNKYGILIGMPWDNLYDNYSNGAGHFYSLGEYNTEDESIRIFKSYNDKLEKGCTIIIDDKDQNKATIL